MTTPEKYTIPHHSLSNGIHHFKFMVDDSFFDKFENSLVSKGNIKVNLLLNKQENIMIADFSINGTFKVPCDRCTEYFDMIISGKNRLLFKLGNEFKEESEEVIIIPKSDHELNLSQYIYEFINLLIPMKIVHPDDMEGNPQCNGELLKLLENYQKKGKSDDEEKEIDPRWEKLKGFNQ